MMETNRQSSDSLATSTQQATTAVGKAVKHPVITISDGVPRMPQWRMAEPVDFCLCSDEQMAIVGPNASGKTQLVNIITGRYPLLFHDPEYDFSPSRSNLVSENIRYISFLDAYGGDSDKTYYLQQRWNRTEMDDDTPTVGQKLEEAFLRVGADTPERRRLQRRLYDTFGLDQQLHKPTPMLSSGELRKFKLAETLLHTPRVLIMDNPFIGLDAATRDQLRQLLTTIAHELTIQIILVLSKTDDIPPFITHVVEVRDQRVLPKQTLDDYLAAHRGAPEHVITPDTRQAILHLPYKNHEYHTHKVVEMHQVSIRYGSRTILKDLDWTVCNGEHWALRGQNGAGKSTLLSLVCADNPQSYACDITLFDQPRGTGESIWDIKKHIGYVSPEMHRAYKRDLPAIQIVASGLKDSIGLYVRPHEDEYAICRFWMGIFGVKELENRTFMKLSSGEQRLLLLARAFVKDPELLILDEPLHGLDNRNRRLAKDIIDTFCQRQNKTLIMVTHYDNELPACIDHHIELKRTLSV
jgi:molybdate transport system ATP-binding protein